jgi:hypothetical protein
MCKSFPRLKLQVATDKAKLFDVMPACHEMVPGLREFMDDSIYDLDRHIEQHGRHCGVYEFFAEYRSYGSGCWGVLVVLWLTCL